MISNKIINSRREINTKTCLKESDEIFNYDTKSLLRMNFLINSSKIIYREGNDILCQDYEIKNNNSNSNDIKYKLCEIIYRNGKYYYKANEKDIHDTFTNLYNMSWLVYKNSNYEENEELYKYKLSEGDIIKLGRNWLVVKKIHIKNRKRIKNSFSFENLNSLSSNRSIKLPYINSHIKSQNISQNFVEQGLLLKKINKKKINFKGDLSSSITKIITLRKKKNEETIKKKKICRICFLEEEDEIENPLIHPCKCSGSMAYIHYQCLLHWLSTKSIIYFTWYSCKIYYLNTIECELCKEKFPDYIRHEERIYSLSEIDDNEYNDYDYISLYSMSPDKQNNKYKFYAKFDDKKELLIGRGNECDLILNDITVSRIHSKLIIKDNNVFIKDMDSKFGTLILIQNPFLEILKNDNLNVQVGRTYFQIKYYQNFFTHIFCCGIRDEDKGKTYEKLNQKYINIDKINLIQNESTVKSDKDDIEDNVSVIGLKIIEKEKEKLKDIYYNFDAITDNQTNRNLKLV